MVIQIIRDKIVVNDAFSKFLLSDRTPKDVIRLIGRHVEIEAGFRFDLQRHPLEIYASTFVGNGSEIIGVGEPGDNGHHGLFDSTFKAVPGTMGTPGKDGGTGLAISITAKTITGLAIDVTGGQAGWGGKGGDGGVGPSKDWPARRWSWVLLDSGGNAADGQPGGQGGSGGHVTLRAINQVDTHSVIVASGASGTPGKGGKAGRPGSASTHFQGPRPEEGPDVDLLPEPYRPYKGWEAYIPAKDGHDAPGPLPPLTGGAVDALSVSAEAISDIYRAQPFAGDWAKHREEMGMWYFRGYLPTDPTRADYLKLAVAEFTESLALRPAVSEADDRIRYRSLIWQGLNILGLPSDLDLVPDFELYKNAWAGASDQAFKILDIGFAKLTRASNLQLSQDEMNIVNSQTDIRLGRVQYELAEATQNQRDLERQRAELLRRIEEIKVRIADAKRKAAKEEREAEIKKTITDVISVAEAVIAVVGAVPTAGASLSLLVPDVVELAGTVYENWDAISRAAFSLDDPAVLEQVRAQGEKVGKDVSDIIPAGKAVFSLIGVLQGLKQGATAKNAKVVALVTEATELVRQELLVAQALVKVASLISALTAAEQGEKQAQQAGSTLAARMGNESRKDREAGLAFIRIVQAQADNLNKLSFYAERAVEIYTLSDLSRAVRFDVGFIDPDLEARYREGQISDDDLATEYGRSWSKALAANELDDKFVTFFSDMSLMDTKVLSFQDPGDLDQFKQTNHFAFELKPSDLPANRPHAKYFGANIVLRGATATFANTISIRLDHGNRYTEVLPDGSIKDTILSPSRTYRSAWLFELEGDTVPEDTAKGLWRRGLCGMWDLTYENSPADTNKPDFSGLEEIEVWFKYAFHK